MRIIVFLIPILFFASFQNCILRSDENIKLEKFNQQYEDNFKKASKKLGLTNLEDSSLSRNDIEIRFHRVSSGYIVFEHNDLSITSSVLVLQRIDNKWNAKIILRPSQTKDDTKANNLVIENIVLSDLDLEKTYQKLFSENISFLFQNQSKMLYSDATLYAIETKINNKYDFTFSYVPNEASEEKDSKQIAKLFNIAAKEFELDHFQAPTHLFE